MTESIDFEHNGTRFLILHLAGMDRIQLWVCASDEVGWEMGHGKMIPQGMTPAQATGIMRLFITGGMTSEDYKRQLPGD